MPGMCNMGSAIPADGVVRADRLPTPDALRGSSLAHPSVDALAQQVSVPAVTGILLDPVHHQLAN